MTEQKRDIGNKVLLLATSHTGNNIFCTPAIRLLKKNYPDTCFDIVSPKKLGSQVFQGNSDINRIYTTRRAFMVRWIARNYTHAIALHYKANPLLKGVSIPHHLSPGFVSYTHDADQILKSVSHYVGCPFTDEDRAYVIPSRPAGSPPVLEPYGVKPSDRVIGVHLGVGRVSIHGWKRFYRHRVSHPRLWPVEKYIDLAHALREHDPNIRLAIIGTRNEAFLGREVERALPGTINLIGKTTVADLASLMHEVELFLSQDSGVLHIASSTEVPIVTLFGPTEPSENGPYPVRPQHTVLKKDSMADYSVDEVVDAVLNRLPGG